MSRNIRSDIASSPVTTLTDADFLFALPSSSGNLKAITLANLRKVLGGATSGVGDPNNVKDGPPGTLYYDGTVGSERWWVKNSALGTLTGWT